MGSDAIDDVSRRIDAEQAFVKKRGGRRWQRTYLLPYYLCWMGIGGQRDEARRLVPEVRERAAELSLEDIAEMTQMNWRMQVMGIWYAVARNDEQLSRPLHRAFDVCFGTLTAPALTAAVLTYPDTTTEAVLGAYRDRDLRHGYGSAGVVDAALRRLGSELAPAEATPEDAVVDGLLETVRLLRALD